MFKYLDKFLSWRADRMAKGDCIVFCHRPEVPNELK